MAEPDWLLWARQIQAMAQTGLAFSQDPYDLDRYRALQGLAAEIMGRHSAMNTDQAAAIFAAQTGYATPKLGVRAGVIDTQGRILMVREIADEHRWTIPGGWADVNQTAKESAAREVFEESGFIVEPIKLVAAWDKARQGLSPVPFSITTLFFLCELRGGSATPSIETSAVGWFGEDDVPKDLSARRVTPYQISRLFAHHRDRSLPTEFD
jgi:ADP-ribose pyrophosphatase YjhB (NUDIX family)